MMNRLGQPKAEPGEVSNGTASVRCGCGDGGGNEAPSAPLPRHRNYSTKQGAIWWKTRREKSGLGASDPGTRWTTLDEP
jgi:hypothetical protein